MVLADPAPQDSQFGNNNNTLEPSSRVVTTTGGAPASGQVGRWTLLKPLARGGMGEVYLGSSGGIEGAERPCVVKIVRREHAEDKSFLARFFDEARIQAQLQHPGVAQVLEASTDQSGKPYVVLEYIEGRNLSEVRQRASQLKSPLAWPEAVAVALTLTEALAHVHERTDAHGRALAIVHRDLSPQNVMVGYAGDVKLIDFGTARGENRRCQTVSGIVYAKPGYVAPEVANQNQPGPPADLYALGIILWELLMGRRFLNTDPAEHLALVAAGKKNPPPVSMSNNVPLALDTAIARLTAPDIRDRYPSAREAAADLNRILARAPSLTNGERSARARISHLMSRLYPAEPTRSRGEFARLVAESRKQTSLAPAVPDSPHPADVSALLPGTRYRIDHEIAKSAMSVVYAATHIDLGRRVALKILPKEHCDNPQFEARFRSEARAIAQLRHENLVTLHDFGVLQDGRPYYAMELLDGETLKETTERAPKDWREIVRLAVQVCDALTAAHATGFVHRDIKPANLFLTRNGTVKLIDFGVAQVGAEIPNEEHSGALLLSGTPEYMAPEQVGDAEVDARADVYALGVVVYELLTGKLPHQGDSTVQLLNRKQKDAAIAPGMVSPGAKFPKQLDWAVLRALAANPAERFESALQFKQALTLALQAPQRLKRTRRVAFIGAGLAAAALCVALAPRAVEWTASHRTSALMPGVSPQAQAQMPEPALQAAVNLASPSRDEQDDQDDSLAVDEPQAAAASLASTAGLGDPLASVQLGSVASAPASAQAPAAEQAAANSKLLADATPSAQAAVAPSDTTTPNNASEAASPAGLPAAAVTELARAESLAERSDSVLQALDLYRKLGQTYPDRPEVLAGWSRTAGRAKWWGEALRVAIRWAETDTSPEAQLHLARTQRLLGQRFGAIQTLERLLERAPANREATSMLERYRKE